MFFNNPVLVILMAVMMHVPYPLTVHQYLPSSILALTYCPSIHLTSDNLMTGGGLCVIPTKPPPSLNIL